MSIHSTSFCYRPAKQPQQLLIPNNVCGALRNKAGRVIQAKLKLPVLLDRARTWSQIANNEITFALSLFATTYRLVCGDHIKRCVTRPETPSDGCALMNVGKM